MKTKLALLTLFAGGIIAVGSFSPYFSASFANQQTPQTTTNDVMSGQEFVDDLNALGANQTYKLDSDVDLSDLPMGTAIEPLEKVTIEGNYHTIYNRSLDDTINLTNLADGVYLFKSIEETTINNLIFDNTPFVFQSVVNSDLNNVNFINTHIDNKTINTTPSSVFVESSSVNTKATGIGLFIEFFANSSWTNSVIDNVSFSDNVINNKTSASDIGTIFVSPISYIKETQKSSASVITDANEFQNIFVNNLSYENNVFQGSDLSSKTTTSAYDYGNASSIYFSPLFAASFGYKTNDSYAKINVNNLVVNNLTYINNKSTITNNTINGYNRGQGIFYSINPAFIVGSQLKIEQSYLFNLDINNEMDPETLINTGYVNSLNNYGNPSKGYTITNLSYYYQNQNLRDYNGFDSVLYKYTDYQTMIDSINIASPTTKNAMNWDENLWEIKQLASDQDPTLYMHYDLWVSNSDLTFNSQNIAFKGVFRTGNFSSGVWDVAISSGSNTFERSYQSGKDIQEILLTETIFDPTTDLIVTFSQNDVSYTKRIDTSYFIPKITRVYNNVVDDKLEVSVDFINNYGYDLAFDIKLYRKNDLIEKFEKQLIDPEISVNNVTFTSLTTFIEDDDYSDYYFDVEINYATDGQNWSSIYDGIINFDDTSLINYRHYEDPVNFLLIGLIVLLIMFLIIIVLVILLVLKRKAKSAKMRALYEQVTGIAEFEDYA